MPIKSLSCLSATIPTVPEPKNVSSTTPPTGHPASMGTSHNSGGNVAKCASEHLTVGIDQTQRMFRMFIHSSVRLFLEALVAAVRHLHSLSCLLFGINDVPR